MTVSGFHPYFRLKDLLLFLPALVAFAVQRILAGFPQFTEVWFTGKLFRWISNPVSWVSSLVPFSLTEALVWSALPLLVIILLRIWLKTRNVREKAANAWIQMEREQLLMNPAGLETFSSPSEQTSRKGNHQQGGAFDNNSSHSSHHHTFTKPSQVWVRALVATGWTASWAYLVFMLLFGFNYARMPAADVFEIDVHDRSVEELAALTFFLARQTAEAREHILEDANGVMRLQNSISMTLATGYLGFQEAAQQWPELRIPTRRAKGVMASRWWSYTRISGMYFPFFVEANVNIAMPHSSIPSTTMHELAHTIGFA
ncbi:MAG: DUF3810 domain-containing protein, partial [Balneolales bacterium]|nr:DUF3810 domain-containing protein [Balneolales bacterium]